MLVITKKSLKTAGALISAAFLLITLGACNNNTTTEPESERKPVEPTTEERTTPPPPGETAQQPAEQPGSARDISDEDLNKFADAYMAVQALSPQYQEQLLHATPEQANEIQRQAAEAMQKEIEKHGMTFEQFTIIAVQLESDPQLQQRFNETLQNIQVEE